MSDVCSLVLIIKPEGVVVMEIGPVKSPQIAEKPAPSSKDVSLQKKAQKQEEEVAETLIEDIKEADKKTSLAVA